MKKYEVNNKWILLILSLIFLVGMFLCSYSTSPLFPDIYGGDSAIFSLLGKGIVNGKTIYVDLFDHKGPMLFFIEALGHYIGGHTGVFMVQCVLGVINLLFSYKIWEMISNKYESKSISDFFFIFTCAYSFLFVAIQGGNLSEEFSLPFITISFYLFVKYSLNCSDDAKHPHTYALFYGVALMSMALMRINNAIPLVAGVFAIFCYLVYRKEFKNLILNIIFGLLGCIIVAIPFVLYFIYKDALYDMIYATFLYNFKYASIIGAGSLLKNLGDTFSKFYPLVLSLIIMTSALLKAKKEELKLSFLDFLIAVIVVINTICLLVINQYLHYYLLYVPILLIVLARYWRFKENRLKTSGVVLCIAIYVFFMGYTFLSNINSNYISKDSVEKSSAISQMAEQIPEDERDSVIGFEMPAAYYLYADIIPCYKYYTYQSWWSRSDPSVMESFLKYVDEEKPKWLLVNQYMCDEEMAEFIKERYTKVDNNKYMYSFRLKE